MKLEISASNGEDYEFKDMKKEGIWIKVEFENEDGRELNYWIKYSKKYRSLFMNSQAPEG